MKKYTCIWITYRGEYCFHPLLILYVCPLTKKWPVYNFNGKKIQINAFHKSYKLICILMRWYQSARCLAPRCLLHRYGAEIRSSLLKVPYCQNWKFLAFSWLQMSRGYVTTIYVSKQSVHSKVHTACIKYLWFFTSPCDFRKNVMSELLSPDFSQFQQATSFTSTLLFQPQLITLYIQLQMIVYKSSVCCFTHMRTDIIS